MNIYLCAIIKVFLEMQTGVVKFFNDSKGFGFIILDSDKSEVFVHVTGLQVNEIREGDRVQFNLAEGKKGTHAVDVRKI